MRGKARKSATPPVRRPLLRGAKLSPVESKASGTKASTPTPTSILSTHRMSRSMGPGKSSSTVVAKKQPLKQSEETVVDSTPPDKPKQGRGRPPAGKSTIVPTSKQLPVSPPRTAGRPGKATISSSTKPTVVSTPKPTVVQTVKQAVTALKSTQKRYVSPPPVEVRGKRVPKPNRKYLNEENVTSIKGTESDPSMDEDDDDESDNESKFQSKSSDDDDFDDDMEKEYDRKPTASQRVFGGRSTGTGRKQQMNIKQPVNVRSTPEPIEPAKPRPVVRIVPRPAAQTTFKTVSMAEKKVVRPSLQEVLKNVASERKASNAVAALVAKEKMINKRRAETMENDEHRKRMRMSFSPDVSKTKESQSSGKIETAQKQLPLATHIRSTSNQKASPINTVRPSPIFTAKSSTTTIKPSPTTATKPSPNTTTKPSPVSSSVKSTSASPAATKSSAPIVKMPMAINRQPMPAINRSAPGMPIQSKSSPTTEPKKLLNKPIDRSQAVARMSGSNKIDLSSELEDFEQMPTFTIVNINDIMNKKDGIILEEKKFPAEKSKSTTVRSGKTSNRNSDTIITLDDDDDDNDDDDDDDEDEDDEDDIFSNRTDANSRRKSHHHVLNDKQMAKKSPQTTGRQVKDGPPPQRILNSTLCLSKDKPTTSLITKLVPKDVPGKQSVNNRLKENLTMNHNNNNKLMARRKEPIPAPSNKPVLPRTTTTITTRPKGRITRVTCFESWHVIKVPPLEEQPARCSIGMTLIELGNRIEDIKLPSDDWSYKVELQKIFDKKKVRQELYTGVVQNDTINPDERHLYQPTHITFSRHVQTRNGRIDCDRRVTFRFRSFSITMAGQLIRLAGSPTFLSDLHDVETLLEIVDEADLNNSCVDLVLNTTK